MTPTQQSLEAARICKLAPVVPVLVIEDLAHAAPLARALVAGGLPALEVTLRTPAAFEATYRFITGRSPQTLAIQPEARIVLNGTITSLGLTPTDPATGNFSNNLPLPGAQLMVYATDPATGARITLAAPLPPECTALLARLGAPH